jgi:hypothetical protein
MFARSVILALSLATLASAQPTTAPATPESLRSLVVALGDRDPAMREQARDKLMQLTRADLPAVAEAARGRPLLPTQRSLLHDVVVHVYLTGKHDFTGDGSGYLGITSPNSVATIEGVQGIEVPEVLPGNGEEADPESTPPTRRGVVVQTRVAGCDGYRVLEVGDVITAITRPDSGEKNAGQLVRVTGFDQLRSTLANSRAGEWIVIRILRNGVEHEIRARLAPRPRDDNNGNPVNETPEGEDYWKKTFERALTGPPTSQPTTRSASLRAQDPNPVRNSSTDVPKP